MKLAYKQIYPNISKNIQDIQRYTIQNAKLPPARPGPSPGPRIVCFGISLYIWIYLDIFLGICFGIFLVYLSVYFWYVFLSIFVCLENGRTKRNHPQLEVCFDGEHRQNDNALVQKRAGLGRCRAAASWYFAGFNLSGGCFPIIFGIFLSILRKFI